MGEFYQAKKSGVLAMQHDPENAEAYYAIGLAEMELNEFSDAISSFDVALELAPNQTTILIAQANAYLLNDNYYSAIENCNTILDEERNHATATDLLRQAFAGLEQHNIDLLEVEIEEPIFEVQALPTEASMIPETSTEEIFEEDPYANF